MSEASATIPNVELMTELLEAGVHYGHQTKRWNPKMREYILEEKNIYHKDSENYLFSLRSTDNFIRPENYSYILNQRINNRFSVLHCNQSDWCHTKNNFDNLILISSLV
jgi:ribosomal protein S2